MFLTISCKTRQGRKSLQAVNEKMKVPPINRFQLLTDDPMILVRKLQRDAQRASRRVEMIFFICFPHIMWLTQ